MKAYVFRLYPNEQQKTLINKTIGSSRFIYNHFLEIKSNEFKESKKSKTAFECCKELKNMYEEYDWLKEVDSCALRTAIFDLDDGFKRFYKKLGNYPKFKKKNKKQSYRTNNITNEYKGRIYNSIKVDLSKRTITLPKLKEVSIKGYRNLEELGGRIINASISKDTTNRYYVSVVVEDNTIVVQSKRSKIVGIDLGVKTLITTSEGDTYDNPKAILKYEKRIKHTQRELSRKIRGSNNYYKCRERLAFLYRKLKNTRKYYTHKITKRITDVYKIIVTEKLDIQRMQENKHLSKSVSDASMYEIIRQLEYKSKRKGNYFYQVGKYYASSQLCSRCENKNKEVKDLSIRNWVCGKCGSEHDRDINASINIMYEGMKNYLQELGKV